MNRVVAQVVSRQPFPCKEWVRSQASSCVFWVDKFLSEYSDFSLSLSFHQRSKLVFHSSNTKCQYEADFISLLTTSCWQLQCYQQNDYRDNTHILTYYKLVKFMCDYIHKFNLEISHRICTSQSSLCRQVSKSGNVVITRVVE
jgi:hypothetical protein